MHPTTGESGDAEDARRRLVERARRPRPEHVAACAALLDLVAERGSRHLGQLELLAALKDAKAPVGDAWVWSRRASSGDAALVIAMTLALAAGEAIEVDQAGPVIYETDLVVLGDVYPRLVRRAMAADALRAFGCSVSLARSSLFGQAGHGAGRVSSAHRRDFEVARRSFQFVQH